MLGDDRIFVTRTSQNANHNENNYFCNINRMSPNVKSLVVSPAADCPHHLGGPSAGQSVMNVTHGAPRLLDTSYFPF